MNPLRWTWRRWHFLLLILGLLLRLGFCLLVNKETAIGGGDGKEYFGYAQSLLAFQGDDYPRYFNCIRPPFYPIFLMPFVAITDKTVWHIQLVQSMLGVLQAFVLAKIAGRWRGQRAGNWAFVLALLHPFLIYYCAYVLTETLFILLLWVGIACLQRFDNFQSKNSIRWMFGGAVALSLACLTRPSLQPFLIVAVLWIGWRSLQIFTRATALKLMVYFTLVPTLLLAPWMIRNYLVYGEITLAPHNTQLVYAQGNSLEYLRSYEAKTAEEYYQAFGRLMPRFSVESGISPDEWMEEAREFRQNHSADWWRLQWYKFKHFWTPWLNPLIFPRSLYLLSLVATTPLFLLAAVELWRRRKQRDPFLVLVLGLVAVGYLVGGFLFHVQVRYRIPFVDIAFLLLTASFLGHFSFGKLMKGRRPSLSEEPA